MIKITICDLKFAVIKLFRTICTGIVCAGDATHEDNKKRLLYAEQVLNSGNTVYVYHAQAGEVVSHD